VGATAQALRIWRWANAAYHADVADAVQRARAWLMRCQLRATDVRVNGGFPAGVDDVLRWRRRERNLYPWVAVFAADALAPATPAPGPIF
jgi:hypothetical protein